MASVITPGPISVMTLYAGPFVGTECFPLIVPTTGTQFANYRITLAALTVAVAGGAVAPTIITSGATLISPYSVTGTEQQILVDKTVGAATGILLPLSASKTGPVFVKDLKGDALTNPISVTFSGGQSCDGLTTYPIDFNYACVWFFPLAAGGYFVG